MTVKERNKNTIKYAKTTIMAALVACVLAQGTAFATHERMLVPVGCTVGIQMFTDGVLVVGLAATQNGQAPSPAAAAGILPGDLITALNGAKIGSAEDFKAEMGRLKAGNVSVTLIRNGETLKKTLEPSMGGAGHELGLWLRDRVSGIGTLTFYDPQSGVYGGLGHGVNDFESGVILPLGRGDIFNATVVEIKKGCAGAPGELCGEFNGGSICGDIRQNTRFGIFGILSANQPDPLKAIPAADSDDIKLGKATVLANIEGGASEEFEVEITRVYRGENDGRSLMLCVKDKRLLEKTGGIVQGMSGSPILQDGKLIGAVTHVMIHDPTKGFGISIELMLEAADKTTQQKAA